MKTLRNILLAAVVYTMTACSPSSSLTKDLGESRSGFIGPNLSYMSHENGDILKFSDKVYTLDKGVYNNLRSIDAIEKGDMKVKYNAVGDFSARGVCGPSWEVDWKRITTNADTNKDNHISTDEGWKALEKCCYENR